MISSAVAQTNLQQIDLIIQLSSSENPIMS